MPTPPRSLVVTISSPTIRFMGKSESTLYNRMGGPEGVAVIIDELYRRILADPELAPFFAHSDVDHIRSMQREFFAVVFGEGDLSYSSLSLRRAHHDRGITGFHFNRFVQHLLDILRERQASEDDIDEVAHSLSLYYDDIVGGATTTE